MEGGPPSCNNKVEREDHPDLMKWPRGSLGLEALLDLRHPIPVSPQEPQVKLTVGNELIDFLINTGTTYSVVSAKAAQKTSQSIPVTGVS